MCSGVKKIGPVSWAMMKACATVGDPRCHQASFRYAAFVMHRNMLKNKRSL